MKEIIELRVNSKYFNLLFDKKEGKDLGSSVKVVNITTTDPRFEQIPILIDEIRKKYNTSFFWSWKIQRKYTPKELKEAQLFHVKIKKTFEPSGEECGTEYEISKNCEFCGGNRYQIGPLRLKKTSIPNKDISRTIAGENIVSSRFAELVKEHGLKGIVFDPVLSKNKITDYYQLRSDAFVDVSPQTVVGINPFNLSDNSESKGLTLSNGSYFPGEKEVYKCPACDRLGLNLISEPYIKNDPLLKAADFFATRQKVGVFRGLLQAEPIYVCSPAFKEMVEKEKLTGFDFEIAHID